LVEEAAGPTSSGSTEGPAPPRGRPRWGRPGEDGHPPGERKASSSVATVKEIAKAASARGWWDWEEEASGRAATDAEVTEELSIWRDLARGRDRRERAGKMKRTGTCVNSGMTGNFMLDFHRSSPIHDSALQCYGSFGKHRGHEKRYENRTICRRSTDYFRWKGLEATLNRA
jgi:hypothetical protein